MRILYFDCFSGISGDMILGAFVDAGLDPQLLIQLPKKLNLPEVKVKISKTTKNSLSASKVDVQFSEQHVHRHLEDIERIIDAGDIPVKVKNLTKQIFRRLAEAEAKVHGFEIDQVHFHEVGALDAIIDVTGAALAYDALKIDRAYSGTIPIGGGTVQMAHGTYPVPAPATALLLKDYPIQHGPVQKELVTPTGAAILTTLVQPGAIVPEYKISTSGYGAGSRNYEKMPNVLRILLGETTEKPVYEQDQVNLLECNMDDMNPQIYPYLIEQVLEAGALDAYVTPITMKKGRPAHLFSALCPTEKKENILSIIFRETTTIGVRMQTVTRSKLVRKILHLNTTYGTVQVKEIRLPDGGLRYEPEFEECKRIAGERGLPLNEVQETMKMEFKTNDTIHRDVEK